MIAARDARGVFDLIGRPGLSASCCAPETSRLRSFDLLGIDDLARAAGLARAQFSREFRRAFGESPHAYLLTRHLERAAVLLRAPTARVAEICFAVGLRSVGSVTSSERRSG